MSEHGPESLDDTAEEQPEGDYEERVRDLQAWLRRRDAERRQSWGNDVVTPENRAPVASPRYFSERGYDAKGFKRLNENTRFRLRSQDNTWNFEEDSHAGSLRRAPGRSTKPIETDTEAEPETSGDRDPRNKQPIDE